MSEPRTKAGRDAVRMRGLFGGETEERAAKWVHLIEAEAAALADAPDDGLRAAAHNVTDRRTLMADGFWVSQKEMRALDAALAAAPKAKLARADPP